MALRGRAEWQLAQLFLLRVDLLPRVYTLARERFGLRFAFECSGLLLLYLQCGDVATIEQRLESRQHRARIARLLLLQRELSVELDELRLQRRAARDDRTGLFLLQLVLIR